MNKGLISDFTKSLNSSALVNENKSSLLCNKRNGSSLRNNANGSIMDKNDNGSQLSNNIKTSLLTNNGNGSVCVISGVKSIIIRLPTTNLSAIRSSVACTLAAGIRGLILANTTTVGNANGRLGGILAKGRKGGVLENNTNRSDLGDGTNGSVLLNSINGSRLVNKANQSILAKKTNGSEFHCLDIDSDLPNLTAESIVASFDNGKVLTNSRVSLSTVSTGPLLTKMRHFGCVNFTTFDTPKRIQCSKNVVRVGAVKGKNTRSRVRLGKTPTL